VRIAPNWRRFVHAFYLCNLPIGLQGPFWGLCLCPRKLRFPTAGAASDVTRQRIYLETMERILGGTDKTIIDTGAQPGPGSFRACA
jgi:hypothetical protein